MSASDVLKDLEFGQRVAEEESALESYFVETDDWNRVFNDRVDIVYGAKGAGKSALYSLLIARGEQLRSRGVVLAPAENPRGALAFRDLVADPPTSEAEFVGLWKLYFVCLLQGAAENAGVAARPLTAVREALEREGLLRGERSLLGLLRAIQRYAQGFFRGPEAVQGDVAVDPATGQPTGFSGKITFREPDSPSQGLVSVDELLGKCTDALREGKLAVWLMLDRLDVAFAESVDLEKNALRALFRVYLDLLGYENIRLKVFLRTDIWRRITDEGFREASHITRDLTIEWSDNALLNVVAQRSAANPKLLAHYGIGDKAEVLSKVSEQRRLFYRMCPDQVDQGERKSSTFDWMLSRTRDGTSRNAPRELIHLLNCLRDEQVRQFEIGGALPEGEKLFARASFKLALPEVSRARLEQTLYAEYPALRSHVEELRGEKTLQTAATLASIWGTSEEEAAEEASRLVAVGFFEQRGYRTSPEFWVPFLYRDALSMVQGSAD